MALGDLDETVRFTSALRDLGCAVAIDDFGAGYTSFRNLKALNVDILKLDGSFCASLAENPDNQYFVRSLIDLARKFELKTVAEWVETAEDAEFLRNGASTICKAICSARPRSISRGSPTGDGCAAPS